jgi:hypothetical protein
MVPHSQRRHTQRSPSMLADCRMRRRREWGTMAAVGRRQPPRSAGHALASFYLAKAHITAHNNQLIRPNRWCADNNKIAAVGIWMTAGSHG